MQLRSRPDAFIRSIVDAATVGPFWLALRDMKQARALTAREATGIPEPRPALSHAATPKAA